MKTFVKVFLLIVMLVILVSVVFAAPAVKSKDAASVPIIPTHYTGLLILKADKANIGAEMMRTNISAVPSLPYTIGVVKDKKTHEFTCIKKYDSEMLT